MAIPEAAVVTAALVARAATALPVEMFTIPSNNPTHSAAREVEFRILATAAQVAGRSLLVFQIRWSSTAESRQMASMAGPKERVVARVGVFCCMRGHSAVPG